MGKVELAIPELNITLISSLMLNNCAFVFTVILQDHWMKLKVLPMKKEFML